MAFRTSQNYQGMLGTLVSSKTKDPRYFCLSIHTLNKLQEILHIFKWNLCAIVFFLSPQQIIAFIYFLFSYKTSRQSWPNEILRFTKVTQMLNLRASNSCESRVLSSSSNGLCTGRRRGECAPSITIQLQCITVQCRTVQDRTAQKTTVYH